ncbi:hypothetical protein [Fuerstiella marisgermanici]|uniref:Uncharacterized protein n=1 Tax=Fuerstiella marisgermanici TaxID=1891926 RepID=A0A1P8WH77_9PLAN|nr:hypothetical protein [Fuerstiella marisgermanici]APZ93424.1 hypothetical protein Fuma_03041 [Fuerstiella marisgermanici]
MSDTKQQPVFKKQLRRGIASAVFERTKDDRTFRSVNLQRSYRKNEEWHRMNIYLEHEDIPFMIEALQATWQFLNQDLPTASSAFVDSDSEMPVEALA